VRACRATGRSTFDAVPSLKGAGVHIEQFAGTRFRRFDGGVLCSLAPPGAPLRQRDGAVDAVRFQAQERGLLARAGAFARRLGRLVDALESSLELCHFRDPWSAAPILFRRRRYATVYEVNGLPSVELPARFRDVPTPRRPIGSLSPRRSPRTTCSPAACPATSSSSSRTARIRRRPAPPAGLDRRVKAIDAHPATSLLPHCARIWTAAGFNSMDELRPRRARHRFMPFRRPLDDQHGRAARAAVGS
jgi:hypothetical protein